MFFFWSLFSFCFIKQKLQPVTFWVQARKENIEFYKFVLVTILKYVLLSFTLITLMIMLNDDPINMSLIRKLVRMWNVFHLMFLSLNAFSFIKYFTIMWEGLNILDISHHHFSDEMFLICFSSVINSYSAPGKSE